MSAFENHASCRKTFGCNNSVLSNAHDIMSKSYVCGLALNSWKFGTITQSIHDDQNLFLHKIKFLQKENSRFYDVFQRKSITFMFEAVADLTNGVQFLRSDRRQKRSSFRVSWQIFSCVASTTLVPHQICRFFNVFCLLRRDKISAFFLLMHSGVGFIFLKLRVQLYWNLLNKDAFL